ncbi:MAG: hypothetical protein GX813_04570 [Erysipelotrichia bacterium]|nr:hypothetical protein [Erysipelotrichia bacterium]
MLRILLKKQLMEVFRRFFYDAKKQRSRSKWQIILMFTLFAFLLFALLGGMFGTYAYTLCPSLVEANVAWLYFVIFSLMAIVFGAFGSVFNTFSGLYLSKDNDLLLSMPIPVKYIVASRLLNVYLLGLMYSSLVIFPAVVIYWLVAGLSFANFIGGLILVFIISLIVLILSCLLGWVVARLSLRFKNKSFLVVLLSLVGFAVYYVVYFQAHELISVLLQNATYYGESVKEMAYGLYMFGRIGEGDLLYTTLFLGITLGLTALVWLILSSNFLKIATTNTGEKKVIYKEKMSKRKPVFFAVLGKEFRRFFSSALYMLNCGLGTILITVLAVSMIVFGGDFLPPLKTEIDLVFPGLFMAGISAVLFSAASMNNICAPSISLEGKSVLIYQSLPIPPKTILHAKAFVQIILTTIPILFAVIPMITVIDAPLAEKGIVFLLVITYVFFYAYSSLWVGLMLPNLNWTSELIPIKQSAPVIISIFGSMGLTVIFVAFYFLLGFWLGLNIAIVLAIFIALYGGATFIIIHYFNGRGGKRFANL